MRHFRTLDKDKAACGVCVPQSWYTHIHYAVTCGKCLAIIYSLPVGCTVCDWKGTMKETKMLHTKKRICPICFEQETPERPNRNPVRDQYGMLVTLPLSNFEPEDE